MTSPTNVAASVRQRLLNRARNDKRPFSELLQYYAMERKYRDTVLIDCQARIIQYGVFVFACNFTNFR